MRRQELGQMISSHSGAKIEPGTTTYKDPNQIGPKTYSVSGSQMTPKPAGTIKVTVDNTKVKPDTKSEH